MPGFDLPHRCQESPKQQTTNVCLSFIYADEPVVSSYQPPTPGSLVSGAQRGSIETCSREVVWIG